MAKTRSLICLFTGHVDHGKSRLIEVISDLSILEKEAGQITQAISAVNVGMQRIKLVCGSLMSGIASVRIPGLLLIDSPGHAAFTHLRKRGGNIADIAVLVVDVNEGLLAQSIEAVEILKQTKTPFIIALNKIDLIPGWKCKDVRIAANIALQTGEVQELLDTKLYELVGKLYELGFNAERFDRISDYTKQIAIIPASAKTKEGVPELLMVLTGLAGKFMEKELEVELEKPGRGVILEVKEQKGMGMVLDVILYDGQLKVNDVIVVGGLDEAIVSKVRCLFEGRNSVQKVEAAACVQVVAPDAQEVLPGMPLMVAENDIEAAKKLIQKEVQEVLVETDGDGVVVKADSLGSLEALVNLLKQDGVQIKRAGIGKITKRDIADAKAGEELQQVILGFNIPSEKIEGIHVITSDIIYHLAEGYKKWSNEKKLELESRKLEKIVRPCKFRILPGYIFRQSNPAVVGVDILVGELSTGIPLMDEVGRKIAEIKSIQENGENVNKVEQGKQVAVSLPGVTVGRQIVDGQILFSDIPEGDFKQLKEMKTFLKPPEIALLKEIADIKRKQNMVWGV